MKKTLKENALQVCLLSSHSLVLRELQRVLKKPSFNVIPRRLESTLASELRRLKIPRAIVYVVDIQAMRPSAGVLLSNILNLNAQARIIVVADKFNSAESYSLLQIGARGLLTFDEAREQLARALPLVAKGGFWVPRALLSGFVDSILPRGSSRHRKIDSATKITPRQQEVLDALLQQLSNKEVGNKLDISARTVKFHVSNILSKYGVRRRSDLILLFSQRLKALPDLPSRRNARRNDPKPLSEMRVKS